MYEEMYPISREQLVGAVTRAIASTRDYGEFVSKRAESELLHVAQTTDACSVGIFGDYDSPTCCQCPATQARLTDKPDNSVQIFAMRFDAEIERIVETLVDSVMVV